ncbi:hypothetical protein L2Y94_15820 [Luteibacter aegosomatis]|uniref:hypothetical protein n=1 Tax=Luteibacter aegosomatis TaxID=2911537 RepID=UPI001FFC0F76|nr:hypothetical protein [Luteibacter aegosomatis]UPG84774.1 hypothetical protein L2Y94_15820 [Luteibacter aegosomatis]
MTYALRTPDTDALLGVPEFMTDTMIHNRKGILHLFATMRYPSRVKVAAIGFIDIAAQGADLHRTLAGARAPAASRTEALFDTCKENVFGYLWDVLKDIVDGIDRTASDGRKERDSRTYRDMMGSDRIKGFLTGVCRKLASYFVDLALSSTGIGANVVVSLLDAVKSAFRRYTVHRLGRGVQVLPGTPSATVEAILGAMNRRLAGDVYRFVANLGRSVATMATAGAAWFTHVASGMIELLVDVVWKIYDLTRMKRFSAEARDYLASGDGVGAFHRRPQAFNRWYRSAALAVPAVAAITLGSKLCGDPMHLLRLFDTEGRLVPQAAYDRGSDYLLRLGRESERYLGQLGYQFRSDDPVVDARLRACQA